MKAIVLYRSKTGYTKSYAEWIAEELQCEARENTKEVWRDLARYDTIIVGGGMYAGGVAGISLLKKNLSRLSGKKVAVWATGCNTGREEEMEVVWNRCFEPVEREQLACFYFRGGFDYGKLDKKNQILMSLFKKALKKQADTSEDARGMLEAYEVPADYREKEKILPLLAYVKGDAAE